MQRKVTIDGFETHFIIFSDGRLMNSLKGNYLKGTIRNGYRYYDMRYNGKKASKSAHRLVAEAFLENPNNHPVVHHKDKNRLNNSISNLEWISYSDNNLSVNKKEPNAVSNPEIPYFDIRSEVWQPYKDTIYMASNYGRIKNNKTGKVLKGKNKGYIEYCLQLDGKKQSVLGHRLVYAAFNPTEKLSTINHINGNKGDNRIINLENITQQENNMKSIYDTKTKQFLPVGQYDKEGNLLQVFTTCAEAARKMGVRPQTINAAIHKNYCSCGFYWKHIKN